MARFDVKSERKCLEDKGAYVTTLLDLYGIPKDFPAFDTNGCSFTRAAAMEAAFEKDISKPNFIANLIVHEFETLLFSDPLKFSESLNMNIAKSLVAIRNQFKTPEHINHGRSTAPSKRILSICESYNIKYEKPTHGILIALDVGLAKIRQECPRFNSWVERLESLA
jgi:hypothetical protein